MTEFLSQFSFLASRYEGFILDLWGVIHDGSQLYPGAKECLQLLRAANKKIVLLSNAPRRASQAAEVLRRMGVMDDWYDALVTSGETAYQCLADSQSGFFHATGTKYIYMGLEKDRGILDGLDYQETADPAQASFLLLSHSYIDNQPLSALEPLLAQCRAEKLPAVCINPDTEVVRLSGERIMCAGVIAADYKSKGGEVIYFGKPHHFVYEKTFKLLSTDHSHILAVGDTMLTDIKGAVLQSIDAALITGGVLRHTLAQPNTSNYKAQCAALFEQMGLTPNYVLPAFNW